MMRTAKPVFIFFLLLYSFHLWSRVPSSPYIFYAPGFSHLAPFPFSNEDMLLFRQAHIRQIEMWGYLKNSRTIYSFDQSGKLISEKQLDKKKKTEIVYSETSYTYTAAGLLQVCRTKGESNSYDSMAYDQSGRIIFYYSWYEMPGEKKNTFDRQVLYSMKLYASTDSTVVLADTTDNIFQGFYTLNNRNEVISIRKEMVTDSVSVEYSGTNLFTRKYWYWNSRDSAFHKGREDHYENNRLYYSITYEIGNEKIIADKTNYSYDQYNRLVSITEDNRYGHKTFLTYMDSGLPDERIYFYNDSGKIYKFNYQFW